MSWTAAISHDIYICLRVNFAMMEIPFSSSMTWHIIIPMKLQRLDNHHKQGKRRILNQNLVLLGGWL